METRSPSAGKVVTMVLFALSCFGLLLFLWLSFGGTLPFNPQGYRIKVAFQNAQELASPADVRIAGVNVGKVVAKASDPRGDRTIVTLEIDPKYAPLHEDATAILRTKTLLGETYVEVTPGSSSARPIPDGGVLGVGHNERESSHDPTAHAEVCALRAAGGATGSWQLPGATLVVTLEPCTVCAGALVLARVSRLVFGAWDPKAGAVGSLWDVVRDRRLNHRPEVVGGVLAAEATALLDAFFATHRRES